MEMDFTASGTANSSRPDERQVRGEIRRGSRKTMADVETMYAVIDGTFRQYYRDYFRNDRRLSESLVRIMPLIIGRQLEATYSHMPLVPLNFAPRKTTVSRTWLQPHLLDDGVDRPILLNGEVTGAVRGSSLYCLIFHADRRRLICVDREPSFFTIQRHCFERFAVRRRMAPEHVLTTLAGELLPLTGLAAAQMMAQGDLSRRGLHMSLALPLGDGLALGSVNETVANTDVRDPYGVYMVADKIGKRSVPLSAHPLTFSPGPDRHFCALIRTAVPDDMLRDTQARFRQALLDFQVRHRDLLGKLYAAVWLGDLVRDSDFEGGVGGDSHIFDPERYRGMVADLVEIFASKDGIDTALDRS